MNQQLTMGICVGGWRSHVAAYVYWLGSVAVLVMVTAEVTAKTDKNVNRRLVERLAVRHFHTIPSNQHTYTKWTQDCPKVVHKNQLFQTIIYFLLNLAIMEKNQPADKLICTPYYENCSIQCSLTMLKNTLNYNVWW